MCGWDRVVSLVHVQSETTFGIRSGIGTWYPYPGARWGIMPVSAMRAWFTFRDHVRIRSCPWTQECFCASNARSPGGSRVSSEIHHLADVEHRTHSLAALPCRPRVISKIGYFDFSYLHMIKFILLKYLIQAKSACYLLKSPYSRLIMWRCINVRRGGAWLTKVCELPSKKITNLNHVYSSSYVPT